MEPASRHNDGSPDFAMDEEKNTVDPEYTGADTSGVDPKKVLTKMDLHLIPMLALLYLLSFLDRGNIGNARIEGLVETLHMTGPQYNWCCERRVAPMSRHACMLITHSDRLLLHLLHLRSSLQPYPQASPTLDMVAINHGGLGDSDDTYGHCARFQRPSDRAPLSRCYGGRSIPRRRVLYNHVVYTNRIPIPTSHVLQRRERRGRVFRAAGICNRCEYSSPEAFTKSRANACVRKWTVLEVTRDGAGSSSSRASLLFWWPVSPSLRSTTSLKPPNSSQNPSGHGSFTVCAIKAPKTLDKWLLRANISSGNTCAMHSLIGKSTLPCGVCGPNSYTHRASS